MGYFSEYYMKIQAEPLFIKLFVDMASY